MEFPIKNITPCIKHLELSCNKQKDGGVMVYWIEPLTLDPRVAGSIPVNAWHFCSSARHFIHIAALHPGVEMGTR